MKFMQRDALAAKNKWTRTLYLELEVDNLIPLIPRLQLFVLPPSENGFRSSELLEDATAAASSHTPLWLHRRSLRNHKLQLRISEQLDEPYFSKLAESLLYIINMF
ncbi:uncharacterized [Tachysurus ichikawai]